MDDHGYDDYPHEIEHRYFTPYCANCDTTFFFLEESWPGGRSSEKVFCPTCEQELGNAEENSKLLSQAKGDLSQVSLDEFAQALSEEDRRKLEAKIGTPKEREAEYRAFMEKLTANLGKADFQLVTSSTDERNPSEIINDYWIYAYRSTGEYPKPNVNSGKWLVFVHINEVDELWAEIKQATESGQLGHTSKVATAMPKGEYDENKKVICVYTYDWTDKEDAVRVRQALRVLGVTGLCSYKSDEDTRQGKYNATGHRVSKYRM